MELLNHTHGAIVSGLAFFEEKSWSFIWTTVPLLKPINFTDYEIVYREGDPPDECRLIFTQATSF